MKTKALDRVGRKRTIIIWFSIRIQHDDERPATSYEIAKGLGLSPSQKLRLVLNEMVSEGVLKVTEVQKQGRWKGRGYMLADGTYERPKRTIPIVRKGRSVDQMSLF